MSKIDKAIQAMYWAADSDQVGYSQYDRESLQENDFFGDGMYNTDCSALVREALQYAGYDTAWWSYSGDGYDALTSVGWKAIEPDGNPKPGYVLLRHRGGTDGHVAMMLYNGDLGQASQSEHGTIDGERGDQTGWEVNTCPYYDGWDWYLIPPDYDESEDDDMSILNYRNKNMGIKQNDEGPEGVDVYQMIWNASEQLTRDDNAGHNTPKGHDIFGRVNMLQEDMADVKKDMAEMKQLLKQLAAKQ